MGPTFITNVLRMMSGTGHDKVSPPIIGVMQGVAPAVQLQAYPEEAHGRKGFEESPAYNVLSGMLELKHRVNDITQLNLIEANSGRFFNWAVENFTWPCCTCCFVRSFEVPNGHIRLAEDGEGNFMIFGPGGHFVRNTFIKLGPLTIITVDEGYSAITQNNGEQMVLPGGKTHLLNHRNWKFEKFMTEKIQTD